MWCLCRETQLRRLPPRSLRTTAIFLLGTSKPACGPERKTIPSQKRSTVQAPVSEILDGGPNVKLLAPLEYVSFVACMQRADILLTDSGGIQEEGPALGKPVLVMREVSERPEAIAAGTACLTGTDPEQIVGAVSSLLDDPARYKQMTSRPNPYVDGHAAERIVQFLISRVT